MKKKSSTKLQKTCKLKLTPINSNKRMLIAKALATHLLNYGVQDVLCLPTAIDIMGMFQNAIDANDANVIIKNVQEEAIEWNSFVDKYHPKFKKHTVFKVDKK